MSTQARVDAEQDKIFIGVHGSVLALDRATGAEIWRNNLKWSDFVNLTVDGDRLFASVKGELYCLDAASGKILWQNKLPGLGWGLITIVTTNSPGPSSVLPLEQKRRHDANSGAAAGAVAAST